MRAPAAGDIDMVAVGSVNTKPAQSVVSVSQAIHDADGVPDQVVVQRRRVLSP